MGKAYRDALGSCEYLADVDDSVDTTCWSLKKQRKILRIRSFGLSKQEKVIKDCKIDCVRYLQDQFDSRPVTPSDSYGRRKLKFNWRRPDSNLHAQLRRNLFPDVKLRYGLEGKSSLGRILCEGAKK